MREEKISICVPTYNRPHQAFGSFDKVKYDNRIDCFFINDDKSTKENQKILLGKQKESIFVTIALSTNISNVGMSINKKETIENSTHYPSSNWALLLDDDNIIYPHTLDAIFNIQWSKDVIYCPSYAMPHFNYEKFSGLYIDKSNVKAYLTDPDFLKLLNTCNYFLHKESYLKTWEERKDIGAADTIWFAYLWLKAGNSFYVVPDMKYTHTVNEDSGWRKNRSENIKRFNEVLGLIKAL